MCSDFSLKDRYGPVMYSCHFNGKRLSFIVNIKSMPRRNPSETVFRKSHTPPTELESTRPMYNMKLDIPHHHMREHSFNFSSDLWPDGSKS